MSVLSEAGLSLHTSQTTATSDLLTSGRITTDSRSVEKGDIFIAYKGVRQDSHKYINEILPKAPGLIIYDNPAFAPADDVCNHLLVRNSREAWAWICAAASDHPQKALKFLGVTGTNGKTSICWILQKLMEHEGLTTLNIGTLGFLLDGKHFLPNKHTTPDPPEFYQALNEARHQGARWVVMECSSHSLSQKKLAPVLFEACGWSSFSRDHLDFHKTMDAYFEAKWQLFTRHLKPNGRAILSKSLSPKPDLTQLAPDTELFHTDSKADNTIDGNPPKGLRIESVSHRPGTIDLVLNHRGRQYAGKVSLFGHYNLENFLIACLMFEKATGTFPGPEHWSAVTPVPGRMEFIASANGKGPSVCVDFAHTPDALEKCLSALKPLTKGKLWLVFGCGGDRDAGKRPEMASVSERFADHIIVTSDNPRFESPDLIIDEIKKGFSQETSFQVQPDREKAIDLAVCSADSTDTILIAGKGHESVQSVKGVDTPFDDRLVARAKLNKLSEGL